MVEIISEQVWVMTVAVGLSVVMIIVLGVFIKRLAQRYQELFSATEVLKRELEVVRHGALGVGERVVRLEKSLKAVMDKQKELALMDTGKVQYHQAARLLGFGAKVEDLVDACGLSRPEAELVSRMNDSRKDHRKIA